MHLQGLYLNSFEKPFPSHIFLSVLIQFAEQIRVTVSEKRNLISTGTSTSVLYIQLSCNKHLVKFSSTGTVLIQFSHFSFKQRRIYDTCMN